MIEGIRRFALSGSPVAPGHPTIALGDCGIVSTYLQGMHPVVSIISRTTHFGSSRPFWVSMPLATEPSPATIAAGGKNDDMPAAIPAEIEIGVINSPGG